MRGGRGGFVESDLDTYDGLNDAFNTEEAVVARGRGVRGAGISFGRGRGRGMNRTGFDSWDNEQEDNTVIEGQDQSLDLIEAAKPSAGLERPRGAARIPDEDEPDAKRAKFATAPGIDNDDRIGKKPYLPYPRDPYGDPYGDPYLRYDPYYRDPYLDPPLAKYGYDRLGYDRFAGLPSRFDPLLERKPFVPAESIDYGHGGVDKEKKSYQPAEVIDYGHGQSSEPKSSDAPRLALDRDRATLDTARGYSDTLRGSIINKYCF
ncbi:unnamed protein product [Lymnaea stagnalis]|uniref:Uncharacterized protein n=1 Tax=Lymnaea stagnalis TaxID=6523 RepID=A0AAV2INT3_LYMST